MLKWVFAATDSDQLDTFMLEANGANLSSLDYMVPHFKLVDEDPAFFDAVLKINSDYNQVNSGSFEWRVGTFSHKIAENIQDEEVKSL